MEGFYGQKENETRKEKEWGVSGTVTFLLGKAGVLITQMTSLLLISKFNSE